MDKDLHIGSKRKLNVITRSTDQGQEYYVVKYGKDSLNVKLYDFQKKLRTPKTLDCVCYKRDRYGRPVFKQDMNTVLYQLYEDDCEYTFSVSGVKTDANSNQQYLELFDEYGFIHKLYNLNYDGIFGKYTNIDCIVTSIKDGELHLENKLLQSFTTPSLATDIELDLFEQLHNKRLNASETLLDPDFINIWRSVIDKYPDSAHFIYEFLQNADDANATHVEIILNNDHLVFKHNGTEHFSVSNPYLDVKPYGHINAITAVGRSQKLDNKIGKFGVGFKSVFTYTDTPEIYDDKFRFRIENYIIPVLIEKDHYLRKSGETLFYVPFKAPNKAFTEIKSKLENLDNPILFLRNLKRINWSICNDSSTTKTYTKKISESFKENNIECQHIFLNNNGVKRELWLFNKSVHINNNGNHLISVGYYITDKGEIDTAIKPHVYCFFPTKEKYDMCIITHAPFELVDSRQNVKENNEVNLFLTKELASLAANTLPLLRDIGLRQNNYLLNDNLLTIIPVEDVDSYYYGPEHIISSSYFYHSYINVIKSGKYFLSRDKQYVGIEGSFLCNPINLASFITDEQLNCLLPMYKGNCHFVFPSINTRMREWYYLVNDIGLRTFTPEKLAECIISQPLFMKSQEDSWLHKLYAFLRRDAISTWKNSNKQEDLVFRYCPILRLNNGDFECAYINDALNVFYSSINAVNTLDDINIIDSKLLENETTRLFFDELGLKEIDKSDYIKKILVKYEEEDSISKIELLSDLKYIYEYSLSCTTNERSILIDTLEDRYKVLYETADSVEYDTVNNVYGLSFKDTYFKGFESIKFIDVKSYEPILKEYGEDNIFSFLHEIGLKEHPIIETIQREEYSQYFLYTDMGLTPSQIKSIYYPNKRPLKVKVNDYNLLGLKNALKNNLSKELSLQIWSWLCSEYSLNYYKYLYCYYIYNTSSDAGYSAESSLHVLLSENIWIYDDNGFIHSPKSITWRRMEKAGYKYNSELLNYLEIKRGGIDDFAGVTSEQKNIYSIGEEFSDTTPEERAKMKRFLASERAKNNEVPHKKTNAGTDNIYERVELDDNDASEMFSSANHNEYKPSKNRAVVDKSKRVEEIEQYLEIEKEKVLRREHLKDEVDTCERYSYGWFIKLLQLEYNYSFEEDNTTSNKAIHISFSCVSKEVGSERIYVLKNPSRLIPIGIEEVGGLEVHFMFSNQDDKVFSFEVASVRDYTLRVKAAKQYADTLNSIDWNKCTCAYININNPVELMSKLINAFSQLGFENDYNLKNNLGDNFSFVFGPPGTGKTTYLANEIVNIIDKEDNPRILVLAPTNKACDVITKKIAEIADNYSWLGRFIATSDEDIENSGLVVDASSELYKERCCIVSTIARLPYDGFYDSDDLGALRDIEWDYVIIDEASMIPLAQIVYALYKFNNSKIIIAGDPLQIAPIVREERWKGENIYTMVNLLRFDNPITEPRQFKITNLSTQYRSIPSIGQLFSEYAYDGKLAHHRKEDSSLKLNIDQLELKPINFITFRVDKTDGVFAPKKLSGSNVHIYSVLLIVEYTKYFAEQYIKTNVGQKQLRIGIICPYAAQAQMIDTLLLQSSIDVNKVSISVGTIHGFQGDECDVIFAVFNPPVGLKGAADKVFLNNKNIINVAISRAKDYLFIFMPHKSTDGFENLREIIKMGRIALKNPDTVSLKYTSDALEDILFGKKFYIENNTFVTTHQMTNVYTEPEKLYEVRIDEQSVDVQINTELAE